MGARHHRGLPRHPAVGKRAEGDRINKPDRLAHLTKGAWRRLVRALQRRLAEHRLAFAPWTVLRVLWELRRLTEPEPSGGAGAAQPTPGRARRAMPRLACLP